MPLKFILIDTAAGTSTIIDEPVGMDKVSLHIRRDENYHGFLDAIDDALGTFQFYGTAHNLLTTAYHTYGIDADIRLLIEYKCRDTEAYDELYRGRFSFEQYKEIRGSTGCYVECSIQNGYDLQTFRNRMNQKISLDSLRCFDPPYSSLPPYEYLGKEITLNPKMVRFLDYATIDTSGPGSRIYHTVQRNSDGTFYMSFGHTVPETHPAFDDPENRFTDTANNEFLLKTGLHKTVVPFTNIRSSEFGEFPGCVGDIYDNEWNHLPDCNEIFHYTPEIPYENNDIKIDIDISGAIFMADQGKSVCDIAVNAGVLKGITWNDALSNFGTLYSRGKRGCRLDAEYLTLTRDDGTQATNFTLTNDLQYNGSPADVDCCTFRYQLSGTYQMFPGEKLYLLFTFDKSDDAELHLVFFSGDYTYTNTVYLDSLTGPAPRAYDGTNPLPFTKEVTSESPISYIKLTFDSEYKATTTSAYLVNEALSRSVELITNDKLRVYSDYFGRAGALASLPYASAVTKPAGRTCLTNGLLLRGSSPIQTWYMGTGQFRACPTTGPIHTLNLTDDAHGSDKCIVFMNTSSPGTLKIPAQIDPDSNFAIGTQILIEQTSPYLVTIEPATGVTLAAPGGSVTTNGPGSQILLTKVASDSWLLANHATMFVSFQEMMEALNCIHAVGFGLEDDPFRSGYEVVRVEPISYFYQDTHLMICDNVDSIEIDASAGEAISVFKTGYTKWEAEAANGLDEFLSKREYRTTLSSLRKVLDKQCKYLASGYAIEVTRRKLSTTTTDWRYDNDNFIICLSEAGGGFQSETGGLAANTSTSILAPDSIYNYRISPARNALRWLRYILNSYQDWANGKLMFMSGDGNYYAQGILGTDPIESTTLNESATLSLDMLADTTVTPLYRNEVVKFKYPMSYSQWVDVKDNKYGLIGYSVNGGATEYGWIQDLKYNLFEGIAEFTLKPKIT